MGEDPSDQAENAGWVLSPGWNVESQPLPPALSMDIPDMAGVEHRILQGDGRPSPSCENVSFSVCTGLHKGLNLIDVLCFLGFTCLCLEC